MGSLRKLLLIFITITSSFSAIIPKEEETELVLVSVIFRHGARTTYSFYPTDPNQNQSFYPMGLGGLTNEGKLGEFKLGNYLKDLYGEFLGEDYTEDKVYIRSTDVTRTKMSALLVLAGLFPPSDLQLWNVELNWQPIPVSYKTGAEEDLFHPTENCPYKADVINNLPNLEEIQEIYIKPYEETYKFIEEKSGKAINTPADMQDFYFILKTESDMDLIMPEWTQEIFPEPTQSLAALVYGYHNYDPEVRKINSGYMLKKILDDSQNKINNPSDNRKIYLYSGHESTLGYMLNALDVYKVHVPPYGSAISFEIHKGGGNQYYMKLRYRNDTEAEEPVDLTIPGCDVLCPLDKFIELQTNLIPTISIQEACNANINELLKASTSLKRSLVYPSLL